MLYNALVRVTYSFFEKTRCKASQTTNIKCSLINTTFVSVSEKFNSEMNLIKKRVVALLAMNLTETCHACTKLYGCGTVQSLYHMLNLICQCVVCIRQL